MKNNTVYPEKGENKLNATSVKLCFENLNSRTYKPGRLIVERQLIRESANSPLRKLAEFANVIVDACEVNESSKNGMTVYVNAVVSGEDKMQKLYEWLKAYAGEDKVEELAPGLMESLGIEPNGDNSVASRFAKYRKLYEEEEAVSEDDDETSDETSDDETSDDKKSDDETSDKDKDSNDEDAEEDELTAVVIEVKKGDEDKAKDELIEAGVDEDDIEILENDDESSDEEEASEDDTNEDEEETSDDDDKEETVKIKISVDSFDALKEYLEGKGFDLEAELGGEIVTGDEDDDKDSDDDSDDELADEFAGFDDLFADEPEEDDKSK